MDNFLSLKLDRADFIALLEQGELEKALKLYKKHIGFSNGLFFSGKMKDEIKKTKQIFAQKLIPLAEKYLKENKKDLALKCYKTVFEAEPQNIENLNNYINLLDKLEQHDLALILAKKLLELEDSAQNYKTLAKMQSKCGQSLEAVKNYETALNLENKPLSANDNTVLGCYYYKAFTDREENPHENIQKAFDLFQIALEMEPKCKTYMTNLLSAANMKKDFQTECKIRKMLEALGGTTSEDDFAYSTASLKAGNIEEGMKYYESRFQKPMFQYYKTFSPRWQGEDLSSKTLLVHYEQGFGDTFLMWGYAPRLQKLAKEVIWLVQDSAVDLLKENDFGAKIIAKNDLDKIKYDYYITTMSLPYVLKLNKSNISVGGGYIKAPKDLTQEFKEKYFNTDKLKVGFAYAGLVNKKRNIPFDKLLVLDKLKNAQLYCFTMGSSERDLQKFKKNKVINISREFKDFSRTAAAMENLDIIVTSDNCILNLAGAMGKKTIGIFNYFHEFRWYDLKGPDCGWYTSVKPLINNVYDDWGLTMQKAVNLVEEFRKNHQN